MDRGAWHNKKWKYVDEVHHLQESWQGTLTIHFLELRDAEWERRPDGRQVQRRRWQPNPFRPEEQIKSVDNLPWRF